MDTALFTPLYCILFILLIFIFTTKVNNLYRDFCRTIKKKNPASFRIRFLKIADLTVFLLFFIQNLLSRCSDIQ